MSYNYYNIKVVMSKNGILRQSQLQYDMKMSSIDEKSKVQ